MRRLLAGPLTLILARARRRPGRWLLSALGIALTVAFAGAVAAEGTIAGDQAARSVLRGRSDSDRAVRVTWQGPVTPSVRRQATGLLRGLGLARQAEVDLLNPVRLDGIVVRVAAIDPLAPWITTASPTPGRCQQSDCPVLAVGAGVGPRRADGGRGAAARRRHRAAALGGAAGLRAGAGEWQGRRRCCSPATQPALIR